MQSLMWKINLLFKQSIRLSAEELREKIFRATDNQVNLNNLIIDETLTVKKQHPRREKGDLLALLQRNH